MSEITHILSQIEQGDPLTADKLLPLVYKELRFLAAVKLRQENSAQTLQATALVHEAYLRLIRTQPGRCWDHRGHFFAAAAQAMRRILVENARRKQRLKHGGDRQRQSLETVEIATAEVSDELLALDDSLDRLQREDPVAAELVQLRYFAGLTVAQSAALLQISPRKADFIWAFARAWLRRDIEGVR
ncbi:MAG: ECF-type sigma factor [Pirellulaceae bacterium]